MVRNNIGHNSETMDSNMLDTVEKKILTGVLWVLKRKMRESESKLKYAIESVNEKELHFVMKSYYHGASDGLKIDIDKLKTNINMIEKDLSYDGYSVRKNDFIERYQRILENMEDDDPVKMEFIGFYSS